MTHAEFETLREEMVEQVVLYASLIAEETGHREGGKTSDS